MEVAMGEGGMVAAQEAAMVVAMLADSVGAVPEEVRVVGLVAAATEAALRAELREVRRVAATAEG